VSSLDQILADRNVRSAAVQKDMWAANARANRPQIKLQASRLWQDDNRKTCVLVAAGPSLTDSLGELQGMCVDASARAGYEIVAVDMALSFLLKYEIVPDFVICSDASTEIIRTLDFQGIPNTLPLLLNVIANPGVAAVWNGPIYWYAMNSNFYDRDSGQWMQDDHRYGSGVTSFLVPGGNVSSLGLSFLSGVRAARKVLLYGHDFCWPKKGDFYCGGVKRDMAAQRIKTEQESGTVMMVADNKGNPVLTNGSLLTFARWYSEQDRLMPGLMENRTPRTILSLGGNKI